MSQSEEKPLPDFAIRWAERPRPEGVRVAVIVVSYLAVFWFGLPALLYGVGAGLDMVLDVHPFRGVFWTVLGGMLWVTGAALVIWSTALFWFVGGGLPISHFPPERLVESGPYRVMAHPIYVGYTGGWLGFGMVVGSPGCIVGSTLLLLVAWRAYTAFFEEPILRARFGRDYDRVKS